VDDRLLGQLNEASDVELLCGRVECAADLARRLFALDGPGELVRPLAELDRASLDGLSD
jgi:hypothetical protein